MNPSLNAPTAERQPIHTVYGGAQLFKADTIQRLGLHARRALETFGSDPVSFADALGIPGEFDLRVHARVTEKLRHEPVEDYRIDFEDGYGQRSDDEEDRHAAQAASEVALGLEAGTLSPFLGIRIKPLVEPWTGRASRTLQLFLTTLLDLSHNRLPSGFAVTLPKVAAAAEVGALCDLLARHEQAHHLAEGSIRVELMIETPRAIFDSAGRAALPGLVQAARGRCRGAHFGPYDYTASLGIVAEHQSASHPACDFARAMMQVALAGGGVALADGPSNILPIPPHRGQSLSATQEAANRGAVRYAWRLHFEHVQRALRNGFYQGWDLHPAQLPARYAAVFSFYLQSLPSAQARLRNFVARAGQATRLGQVFDDAASVQGLLSFFRRGLACGALTSEEAGVSGEAAPPAG